MAAQWYCRIRGEETGPFDARDLKSIARSGQLLPENLVRKGAEGSWVVASKVQGLFKDTPTKTTKASTNPPAALKPLADPAALPEIESMQSLPQGTLVDSATQSSATQASNTQSPLGSLQLGAGPSPLQTEPEQSVSQRRAAQGQPSELSTGRIASLSVTSIVVGLIAIVIFRFPIVSLVLGCVSAIFAFRAAGMVLRNRAGGLPFVVVAGVIGLCACLLGAYGTFFGPGSETKNPIERARLYMSELTGGGATGGEDWHGHANEVVTLSNVKTELSDISVMPVPGAKSKTEYLLIKVRLQNVSNSQSLTYNSWSGTASRESRFSPTVTDAAGKIYGRIILEGRNDLDQLGKVTIRRRQNVTDVLIFQPPPADAGEITLSLPAAAFGSSGTLHFRIVQEFISRNSSPQRQTAPRRKPARKKQTVVEIKKEEPTETDTPAPKETPEAEPESAEEAVDFEPDF